jgi:hypothetical protein
LCQPLLNLGGWGTLADEDQFIPNRNIFIYNNIVYNPIGTSPLNQIFDIRGPVIPPVGSGAPNPARSDQNLIIRGNVIWVQPAHVLLGVEDPGQGCQPSNSSCNATQLVADNSINTLEPQFADSAHSNFHPLLNSNLLNATTYTIPAFAGGDLPTVGIPAGTLVNLVTQDYNRISRTTTSPPGAFVTSMATPVSYVSLPLIRN